jgi:glycerol-3-phosphate dehydrogenase
MPVDGGVRHDPITDHAGFPGLTQELPSAQWCRDHEFCHTLDDYLRRRTNIAQWVAREGLGRHDENLAAIDKIALTLNHGDHDKAAHSVRRYRERVQQEFDSVLASL